MKPLADRECAPCTGDVAALTGEALEALHQELNHGWRVIDGHHLEKEYRFKNFREALAFTNQIGELAESVNHHPDIHLAWGKVTVQIWTHIVDGLTETDFVFAAKTNVIFQNL